VTFTPESYTSHMTVRSTAQGKVDTMVIDASGTWMRGDCGNVKPLTPGK